VRATFLGQPFKREQQLGSQLNELIRQASAFHAITAWTQLSGLTLVEDSLRDLRLRGGTSSILVGVDGGIATKESLALALDLFDLATVFHDTGNRLFHPKVYKVELPSETVVITGSSNLTGSGLFANYEANVMVRLDPTNEGDSGFLEAFEEFRDSLTASSMPAQGLSGDLIEKLATDERLLMRASARVEAEAGEEDEADPVARAIFGAPVRGLPGRPRKAAGERAVRRGAAVVPSAAVAELRWWKTLTKSDALRKPKESNPRNYVTLTKSGHAIDQKTWFRDPLLASASWSEERMRTGKVKEVTEIPFDVWVGDEWLGHFPLRVDHAVNRIADQGNSPTYLNWSGMIEVIRETDYSGWWLEIARLDDGAFRLRLLPDEPVES
jgi:HKD family nuclease